MTITGKQSPSATYSRSGSGGSLAALGLKSNDQFDLTITGDLSDQERSDIQATLAKLDSAKSSFESGNFSAGMQAMQGATQGGGTVESVSGLGGPPPGGPPPGASGATDTSNTDALLSLLDSDSDDDSSGTVSSLLSSGTKKSSHSHHSKSTGSLASALSSSDSGSTIDDFLQQVLNGLKAGSTQSGGTSSSST